MRPTVFWAFCARTRFSRVSECVAKSVLGFSVLGLVFRVSVSVWPRVFWAFRAWTRFRVSVRVWPRVFWAFCARTRGRVSVSVLPSVFWAFLCLDSFFVCQGACGRQYSGLSVPELVFRASVSVRPGVFGPFCAHTRFSSVSGSVSKSISRFLCPDSFSSGSECDWRVFWAFCTYSVVVPVGVWPIVLWAFYSRTRFLVPVLRRGFHRRSGSFYEC